MSNIAPAMPKQGETTQDTPPVEIVKETPVVESVTPEFAPHERIPSDWEILPEGDMIRASNNKTGKVFVGELTAFNALLRGTR